MHQSHFCIMLTAIAAACSVFPVIPAIARENVAHQFEGLVQDARQATAARYQATDDKGNRMDTVKIIQDDTGGYLAVYHAEAGGSSNTYLATSTDILTWKLAIELGKHATQPYIYECSNHGFIVAWEEDPNNHIQLNYYPDRQALLSGKATHTFNAPQTLSHCAEGTPSIYSVEFNTKPADIMHSAIDVGGHYYRDCIADRQQRGTLTDFTTWKTAPADKFNDAIEAWGVKGNIGDRDSVTFKGQELTLIEGMQILGNWATWGIYCYDPATGKADRLGISTTKGSTAFANPSCTLLRAPDGRKAVLVTLFIPSEGSSPGESGELIYYKTY